MTFDEDPEALRALQKLDAAGKLSAEVLEKAARNPNHPIHSKLEWDDAHAGYRHRIDQCRTIIRSYHVEITVDKHTLSVPVFIHDVVEGTGYISTTSLRDRSEEDRNATLFYEFSRCLTLVQRAAAIAESVGADIKTTRLLRDLQTIVSRLAPPPEEEDENEAVA